MSSGQIDWDKSFFMDATMVAIAGLEGISINDQRKNEEEE
jgi:hypothetical protein